MVALGFSYGPSGKRKGSGRAFTAPTSMGAKAMRVDEVSSSLSVGDVPEASRFVASWAP